MTPVKFYLIKNASISETVINMLQGKNVSLKNGLPKPTTGQTEKYELVVANGDLVTTANGGVYHVRRVYMTGTRTQVKWVVQNLAKHCKNYKPAMRRFQSIDSKRVLQ